MASCIIQFIRKINEERMDKRLSSGVESIKKTRESHDYVSAPQHSLLSSLKRLTPESPWACNPIQFNLTFENWISSWYVALLVHYRE